MVSIHPEYITNSVSLQSTIATENYSESLIRKFAKYDTDLGVLYIMS